MLPLVGTTLVHLYVLFPIIVVLTAFNLMTSQVQKYSGEVLASPYPCNNGLQLSLVGLLRASQRCSAVIGKVGSSWYCLGLAGKLGKSVISFANLQLGIFLSDAPIQHSKTSSEGVPASPCVPLVPRQTPKVK